MIQEKLRIALISDYFYPNKGGVETHIQTVGEELIKIGHSVIIITHEYKGYKGLVMLGNLPVYYLDIPIITMNTTFPTIFTNLSVLKAIFDKHQINIVHGHQSLSNLAMEGVFHASHLNIRTVFTDHSVFEVSKFERVLVNNLSFFVCKFIDRGVCVSNISRVNTHMRTGIPLEKIHVIPNGIIPERFYPINCDSFADSSKNNGLNHDSLKNNRICSNKTVYSNNDIADIEANTNVEFNRNNNNIVADKTSNDTNNSEITAKVNTHPNIIRKYDKFKIIYMSRLTFRKGVNLFADTLPLICKNKNFQFLIVGNGPMKGDLEQVIDENDLHDQVEFLNEVDYKNVPDILRSGHIFLNTSLTETFCLANLEAAACGLIVVSTNVGGVSEVLGPETILFCEPTAEDIAKQLENASKLLYNYDAIGTYEKILEKYSWEKVAKETEKLYYSIHKPNNNLKKSILSFNGPRNFICRLGIILEYIQIGILKYIESKYKNVKTDKYFQ